MAKGFSVQILLGLRARHDDLQIALNKIKAFLLAMTCRPRLGYIKINFLHVQIGRRRLLTGLIPKF
jgi:hypothetical protein